MKVSNSFETSPVTLLRENPVFPLMSTKFAAGEPMVLTI
jgi:hypothetical protein